MYIPWDLALMPPSYYIGFSDLFSSSNLRLCVITEPGTLACNCGSQPGTILLQRGHLAMSGKILVVTAGAMLLSSSGYRSGILLNILQYTRQPSTKKDLVPQVSGAELERPQVHDSASATRLRDSHGQWFCLICHYVLSIKSKACNLFNWYLLNKWKNEGNKVYAGQCE